MLVPHSRAYTKQIVPDYSALLQVAHEKEVPVYANHTMICKFESSDDETYQTVCTTLQKWLTSSAEPVSQHQAGM